MKSDSIAFGVAGVAFGLIAGWVIGSQQAALRPPVNTPPPSSASRAAESDAAPPAAVLDQAKVNAFQSIAEREAKNSEARVQLGNLYFDAERYTDAAKWYEQALKLTPNDVNVSTDLGICYYQSNQPDKALDQFKHSLQIDPKHTKTLLNVGIVKAFGKQDLEGALQAWQQVIDIAPNSPEGQKAKEVLDSLKSAHQNTGGQKPGN
jgi:tetratricopeptide (TPR) repeat protein